MIRELALMPIFGTPMFIYFGLLALLGFLSAATIAVLNRKGIHLVSFAWHPRVARISIALAIIHAVLAISLRF